MVCKSKNNNNNNSEDKSLEDNFFSRQNKIFDTDIFKDKVITIIGLGGLGSNVFDNLLRLGFENFILIDFDKVEESNIHRTIFKKNDVGKYKVDVLKNHSRKVYGKKNNIVVFKKKFEELEEKELKKILESNLFVDCTDNIIVRKKIGKFFYDNKKDYVYGSAVKEFGEAKLFLYDEESYNDIYKDKNTFSDCRTVGVNPFIMKIIALLQSELVKQYFLKERKDYERKILRFDLRSFTLIKYKLKK